MEAKDEIRLQGNEIYYSQISKNTPKLRGLASFFIWGLGQIQNKQVIKGLVFLFFQIVLIAIEIFSGKYIPYLTGALNKLDIRDTGIFVKGIWGVVTLGTREDVYSDIYFIPGDRSNRLLINGLIAILILVIFLGIYIYNIMDAKKSCEKQIKTKKILLTSQYLHELWEGSFEYIVILPALILMIFFSIMPIIFGLMVAFTNYGGKRLLLFDWVGFDNFALLTNFGKSGTGWGYTFINVSLWTIVFAIFATITCFFGGLIQAIILNNKRVIGRKIWRTIIILPWAIPQLVLLLVISNAFNSQFGLINNYLREWGLMSVFQDLGLTNQSGVIGWFDDQGKPWLAKSTVILVNMFLGTPYYMALMTGIMTSIDKTMYEAADIDGATPNQKFWKITLPIVLYMTAPLLIMSFAFNLNNFGLIYFLTGGGPGNIHFAGNAGSTDILISWIYKLTTDSANPMYNMASVFSIIIFIVIGSFSAYNFTKTKAFKEEDMV
ncbi:sugar ABC transporter permease [Mycoplasmatota bacterium]|nr:sugar ABC transporter permease [Mycoplasmatota bacterium]